jgi:hypothetical protein
MASFGKVLNLLDDRYLQLHDVRGNVEPLPTLIPQREYAENIFVYRMDTNQEIFMALLQDLTVRTSRQLSKELWTWCIQWEADTSVAPAPSPKKPRLDNGDSHAEPNAGTGAAKGKRRAPVIDTIGKRVLDPDMLNESDMLRILVDIVQVNSTIVPNFVEFLYRWIDFYAGDGRGLRAAMNGEIPSLWDFEYHPLLLPDQLKEQYQKHKFECDKHKALMIGVQMNGAEELVHRSPTKKMREKPDLAAMERQCHESERLNYREVKYGIQPPKLEFSLPPLINIPRDPVKRAKYYNSCFKSRQRALLLLLDCGVTIEQIGSYSMSQSEDPRDTPVLDDPSIDLKDRRGLLNYYKDALSAQDFFRLRDKQRQQREKQQEIAISDKLAAEAQLAKASGIPITPHTPSIARRPDVAADILRKLEATREQREEKIDLLPTGLVGLMGSKIYEGAKEKGLPKGDSDLPYFLEPSRLTHDLEVVESGTDENSDDGDDDATGSDNNAIGAATTAARPSDSPRVTMVAEHMRNLSPEEVGKLIGLMNETMRPAMPDDAASRAASSPAPMPGITTTGTAGQGTHQTGPIGTSSHLSSSWSTNAVATGAGQSPAVSLQTLLALLRPSAAPGAPVTHELTLPFRPAPSLPLTPPAPGTNGQPSHHHVIWPGQNPPLRPPTPHFGVSSSQGSQQMPNRPSLFSGPPQISGPQQT